MSTALTIAVQDRIARITLSRPEVRNAFNDAVIQELKAAFEAVGARDDVRAAVQGDVFAGGMGLVAACDMAVSVDSATYCLSEVKLGLIPATISPYVIRAMGARASHRYFLTAERFSAQEAHRIGFVHELVSNADALDAKVNELAQALVSASPAAVRACKKLVQDVAERAIDDELIAATVQGIADIRASEQGREGVQSFLQKRKPAWLAGWAAPFPPAPAGDRFGLRSWRGSGPGAPRWATARTKSKSIP